MFVRAKGYRGVSKNSRGANAALDEEVCDDGDQGAARVLPLTTRPTMGADSHRRFYKGRPQPCEVPYTPATPTAVPRSQRRNQQRQRQRESQAGTVPADEVLGLLGEAATAAAGCRALARCGDVDVDSNLLEALVEALHAHGPVDAAVARHGCTALVSLCRLSADKQAQVAAFGAFAAAAACARAHPQHLPQACAAVEALCTGKGAAVRRERAVEAGWLELLISACSAVIEGGEGGEGGGGGGVGSGGGGGGRGEDGGGGEGGIEHTPAVGMVRAALRSITRDSMQLQQAALDAGALRQWLL